MAEQAQKKESLRERLDKTWVGRTFVTATGAFAAVATLVGGDYLLHLDDKPGQTTFADVMQNVGDTFTRMPWWLGLIVSGALLAAFVSSSIKRSSISSGLYLGGLAGFFLLVAATEQAEKQLNNPLIRDIDVCQLVDTSKTPGLRQTDSNGHVFITICPRHPAPKQK